MVVPAAASASRCVSATGRRKSEGVSRLRLVSDQPRLPVSARFIRDSVPHDERVVNTFGDVDSYVSEGVVEFTLNNQVLRLRPFTTRPKHLYIVFSDETSGNETYEAARFLTAELRDDGTTILDFNEAYNPPCAFNPFTTCPIPLQQNRLLARVLAGEKKYPGHVEPAASITR